MGRRDLAMALDQIVDRGQDAARTRKLMLMIGHENSFGVEEHRAQSAPRIKKPVMQEIVADIIRSNAAQYSQIYV